MKKIYETDDGVIAHLTWDEYKGIRHLVDGWDEEPGDTNE